MFNDLVLTKKTLRRISKKLSYLNWPVSDIRGTFQISTAQEQVPCDSNGG